MPADNPAQDYLYEQLAKNARGARQKAAEGNLRAAYEEFHVGLAVCRMALNTDPDDLSETRIEAAQQLAWTESGLQQGWGVDAAGDLGGNLGVFESDE